MTGLDQGAPDEQDNDYQCEREAPPEAATLASRMRRSECHAVSYLVRLVCCAHAMPPVVTPLLLPCSTRPNKAAS